MRIAALMAATLATVAMAVAAGCGATRLTVVQQPPPAALPAAHQLSGARDTGVQAAELDVVSSATSIDVLVGDTAGKLFVASTPTASTQLPQAVTTGGHIRLGLASGVPGGGQAASILTVTLDPAVVWSVVIDGGATDDVVDAHLGSLAAVTVAAGATSIELTLPPPKGTMTVHESGGASRVAVHLGSSAPAQVRFAGGAGSAVIDNVAHSGIGGGTAFAPADWAAAPDRYDIEADAGVSSLTLDRSVGG